MKSVFYTEIKYFSIYALVNANENIVFVGKTSSPRISAVYSRHICGNVAMTRGYFDEEDEKPELYILSVVHTTEAIAYKYILAWINLFIGKGYFVLCYDSTRAQALEPKADTAEIIDSLKTVPFEEMLRRKIIARPVDADKVLKARFYGNDVTKFNVYDEKVQLNLRIEKSTKKKLDAFRNKHNLTQTEAIKILLDYMDEDENNESLHAVIRERDKKIAKLQAENARLRKQCSEVINENDNKAFKLLEMTKYAISLVIDHTIKPPLNPKLKPMRYKQFMRQLGNGITYNYPNGDGVVELFLEEILYSKSRTRAYFVIATTARGERIKLRYYPKREYIGPSIIDSPYSIKYSRWMVVYATAADGAKDIYAAYPIPTSSIELEMVLTRRKR